MAPRRLPLPAWARRVSLLERETAGLMGSSGLNLVLGLAFWVGAARLYPTASVGRATTMVSVAGSLASFTNLGLGPVVERFAGRAGTSRGRLVGGAYAVSLVTTGATAAAFCLLEPVDDLFGSGGEAVVFSLLAVVLAAFALQDSDLISAGATRLVAVKNALVSGSKLVVLLALSAVGTAVAIAGSWLGPAAVALGGFAFLAARRRGDEERRLRRRPSSLPPRRAIGSFWGATLGWLLAGSVPSFVVPLVVVEETGLTSAAHFNATWMIVSASAVLMTMASSPYVAAAARPESDLPALTRSFVRFMVVIGVVRSAGLAVAGSVALVLYGGDYARQAIPLLLVMAVVHLLSTPAYVYGALARVHRRVWHPMVVQAAGSLVVVALVPPLVRAEGIVGVGYAYLAQEVVVVGLAAVPLVRLGRLSRTPGGQAA